MAYNSDGLKLWWAARKRNVVMTWNDKSKALFGIHYRSVIAILAGVNKRTVERWDKGEFKIKPDVVDKINATYEIWRK